MVAYSFQGRFIDPIRAGTKRQTIRAIGKRRHAQPGDTLQLYFAMRTKHCELIARSVCTSVVSIDLGLDTRSVSGVRIDGLDQFAKNDGFEDWAALRRFWAIHHPGVTEFSGLLIRWGDLT
jgi:hypothetical protein